MNKILLYLEIAAFISSLITWQQIKSSNYMRLFPFLLFVIAVGEITGYLIAVKYNNNQWFYNLLNPLMHLLYFAIFYYSINSKRFKTFIVASAVLYIIVTIITHFYCCYEERNFNQWMYITGVSIIIICTIRKLYELLEDPSKLDFLKMPFFYMLVFTLLFYTVTIPNFVMLNWIERTEIKKLVDIVNNASNVFNILLYVTYTIAFLWIKKTGSY